MKDNVMKKWKNIESEAEAREVAKKRIRIYRKKALEGAAHAKLSKTDTDFVKALLGVKGFRCERLLGSDGQARWKASSLLSQAMLDHREQQAPDSVRTYIFGTFVDDIGITSDRSPIVQLKAIKDKVYRALKSLDLSAVAVVEVHPLMNYPGGGEGRSLLFHAHVIAWNEGPFDCEKAADQLNKSHGWKCSLDAPPVDMREITDLAPGLPAVAHYALKPPHSAKNQMPSKKKPGKYLLMNTLKGYRPEFALRLAEGLSQIELLDLVFAVGDGAPIRQSVRADLMKWQRSRPTPRVLVSSQQDVWRRWFEIRQKHGSTNYLPFRYVGAGGYVPERAPKSRKVVGSRSSP